MKKICTLIAAVAAVGTINANIVYTDIVDATLISGGSIDIDMNGATGAEFTISDNSFGGNPEPGIFFNQDAHFITVSAAEWDVIKGISINTPIDASSSWEDQGDAYIDPMWGTTMFPNGNDTYIGTTFKLGSNVHYGWIRVNWTSASGTFIVKDFAYETTPNTLINAGDIGGASTVLVTSITVQGQAGASTITIPSGTLQMEETVLPANATNSNITWSVANGTGSATISATGLLTATGNGTVTVTATAEDASGETGTVVITITNQSTGIQESFSDIISIYPNPASDFIQVTNNIEGKIESLSIYSLNGQAVQYSNMENQNESIDIRNLSKGAYVIVLTSKDGLVTTKKFMKK